MAIDIDRRIIELPKPTTGVRQGVYAKYNPVNDKTEQLELMADMGAVRAAGIDWQTDSTYSIDDIVLFNLRAWKSLQNNNTGNAPAENTFWTEIAISEADGITDTQWAAGLFTYDDSKVVYNNAQYYLQTAAPFESADIAAEITAGNWAAPGLPQSDYIDMSDQGATEPPYSEARFWYGNGSFNIYDAIAGTSIQVGKEIVVDMYNNNGTTLTNYTAVRYGPAVNGFPSATRAQADSVINANSFGVCTNDILVTDVGKVTTQGLAGGDTSAWNANDILYLSATVPGGLTNVEQAILKPVARVIVADTEANGGSIYVFQQGIINVTALGQAGGEDEVQLLTTTPEKLEVYDANKFELNVAVTQVGAGPYTAEMSPASVGAGGFYRVSFSISIGATGNTQHIFQVYINGTPTGQLGVIDTTNNNIDAGSTSFSAITQVVVTSTDVIEMYAYVAATTSTITAASVTLNMERIGNV